MIKLRLGYVTNSSSTNHTIVWSVGPGETAIEALDKWLHLPEIYNSIPEEVEQFIYDEATDEGDYVTAFLSRDEVIKDLLAYLSSSDNTKPPYFPPHYFTSAIEKYKAHLSIFYGSEDQTVIGDLMDYHGRYINHDINNELGTFTWETEQCR